MNPVWKAAVLAVASVVSVLGLADLALAQRQSRPPAAASRERVREVQQALKDAGHDPGPIDGILGPRTRAALRKYASAPSPPPPAAAARTIERFRQDYPTSLQTP